MRILPGPPYLVLTIIVAVALLFLRLDYLPLKFEEPRRALVSTEMIISGDYLTPTLNGRLYYNKPPLYNWVMAGCFQIFGFHHWVVRLPTVLSLIGMSILTFFGFRKKLGSDAALLATLFIVCCSEFLYIFSFLGEIDMFYSLLVYAQLLSIIHFFHVNRFKALFVVSYLLMAAGFLTKGLPSIAFQGISLLVIFIYFGNWRKLFLPSHFVAGFVGFGLIACYFLMYHQEQTVWPYLNRLIGESSRRTTQDDGIDYLFQLFRLPVMLLKICLPWSAIFAISWQWKRLIKLLHNPWVMSITLCLIANLIVYWISPGTRERYLYMFVPLSFICIAVYLSSSYREHLTYWLMIALGTLLSTAVLILGFVKLPVTIPEQMVVSLFFAALFVGITIICYSKKISAIFGVLLLLLALRGLFVFTVFPIRKQNFQALDYYQKVDQLLAYQQSATVYFYAPETIKTGKSFISNEEVVYKEISYLPFRFSYLYTIQSGTILAHVDKVKSGSIYLASLADLPTDVEVLDQFTLDRNRAYVVFQIGP
ncbi:MAG: glycosyltransferase family 39 protein [Cyclobacteriaceae bacterium]|nr:glycosyltransferase family 39 protein [Cyclobacteriaceae bacterium HetDA_MAG_MS6]